MPENIGDIVKEIFSSAFGLFLTLVSQWYWPLIFVGLMILAIIVVARNVRSSYENKLLKSINKLNKYFLAKPYITDENLIEFNNKMKNVPSVLRSNWQIYMLNREDGPTAYMNVENCIDKPLRSSSIEKHIGNFTHFTIFLILLSFVCGIPFASSVMASATLGEILFYSLIVPGILLLLYTIFVLIFKASKNDVYAVLYENFPLFERNITKAVSTLPGYVDYEILFTKKEIKSGIPILQEYLEKRALKEREEMEKARQNSMASEEYDFNDLGVDGSLVLDRAMKESESFIKSRRRLQDEINSIETEKENYKKTFETNSKDMQRKLQASRENLESLKKQQEESTNRIEINYIRKQLADEMKKQQQLEKDLEDATGKFEEEQVSLQKEMEKREKEIEEKKDFVEKAMLLEFKHYANTLFKALAQKAADVSNEKLIALQEQNSDLRTLINDLEGGVNEGVYDESLDLVAPEEVATGNLYNIDGEGGEYQQDYMAHSQEAPAQSYEEQPAYNDANAYVQEQPVQYEQPLNETYQGESQPVPQEETPYPTDTSNLNINNYFEEPQQEVYQEQPAEMQEQYNDMPEDLPQETEVVELVQEAPEPAPAPVEEPVVEPEPVVEEEPEVEEEPKPAPKPIKKETPAIKEKPVENKKKEKAPVKKEVVEDDSDDELEALQKQIEAENEKLRNEKDKLSEELSSTLSDIEEDEEGDAEPKERKKRTSNASTAPREPKQRAKSRRIDTSAAAKKKAEPKKRSSRRGGDDDSDSGLDALNAEMQKLLSKAK